MAKGTTKIPAILLTPIIIGAIVLCIAAAVGFFYGLGYIEGAGSLIAIVIGWIGFRIGNRTSEAEVGRYGVAIGIIVFATMGTALDQTGNCLYNLPMEYIFCPEGSSLWRETAQKALNSGGVQLRQQFTCMTKEGNLLRTVSLIEYSLFRFAEYVIIGYLLLGVSRLYSQLKRPT